MALFLHVLLLVVLSFWTVARHLAEESRSVEVRMLATKRVVPVSLAHKPEDALADVSANLEQELSGADVDSPFKEAHGDVSGALKGDMSGKAFGIGAGGGRGLGRGGRGGASSASEAAVHRGLDWLARHRSRAGVWRPLDRRFHTGPADLRRHGGGTVGQTALALLCFVCAGHGPDKAGPYLKLVERARDWLMSQVDRGGKFKTVRIGSQSGYYAQAIGTLVLSECLARKPSRKLRQTVQRLVGYIQRNQTQYGWRYGSSLGRRAETDTSVTSWMILALKSAEQNKIKVDPKCYKGVKRWLTRVTNPETGTTGYMTMHRRYGAAMTATGLFLRILLGESPTGHVNRMALRATQRIRVRRWRGAISNLYAVYYGALAMYQVGGRPWRRFNPLIRDELVRLQHRGPGCERGSWVGGGWIREPIAATSFAILTLETYYRYLPVHKQALTKGEKLLELANRALDKVSSAKRAEARGMALAAEAKFQRALAFLDKEGAEWDLRCEGIAGLVKLALLVEDVDAVKLRAKEYMAVLPPGQSPDPIVKHAMRAQRFQRTILRFRAAAKQARQALANGTKPEAKNKAHKALLAARAALERDLGKLSLDAAARKNAKVMLAWADETLALLLVAGDPDRAIAEGLKALSTGPAQGAVGRMERRLLQLLAVRANRAFDQVRKTKHAPALAQGNTDLAAIAARKPKQRLAVKDWASLDPLIQRAEVSRLGALLALKQQRAALSAAQAFVKAHPASRLAAQALTVERAVLYGRFVRGKATPTERKRLFALMEEAGKQGPLPPPEALTLADLLRERGSLALAARHYRSILASKRATTRPLRIPATLGLAAVRRRQKRLLEARTLLQGLPKGSSARLDVVLERCLLLRAERQPRQALKEYLNVLRVLEHTHKDRWWDVAEQTALAYVEARQIKKARDFLEGLRMKDTRLGKTEARRQRLLSLMRRVDVMKD